jgi:hypothetical protein
MPPKAIVIVCLLACAGCASKVAPPALSELKKATYRAMYQNELRFIDGKWDGGVYGHVEILPDLLAFADTDQDGTDETIAVVSENGGGTGRFGFITIFDRVDGKVIGTPALALGDRVGLEPSRPSPAN